MAGRTSAGEQRAVNAANNLPCLGVAVLVIVVMGLLVLYGSRRLGPQQNDPHWQEGYRAGSLQATPSKAVKMDRLGIPSSDPLDAQCLCFYESDLGKAISPGALVDQGRACWVLSGTSIKVLERAPTLYIGGEPVPGIVVYKVQVTEGDQTGKIGFVFQDVLYSRLQ